MRNMMVFEQADGSVVAGSVTDVVDDGQGGLTVWYGYRHQGQPCFGRLESNESSGSAQWWENTVDPPSLAPAGSRTTGDGTACLASRGPAKGDPVVLEGWWSGPAIGKGKNLPTPRLSWVLRFARPRSTHAQRGASSSSRGS